MNSMTTRQKLRLQLPHKNTKKILKYDYTTIKYSRGANTYIRSASTSIVTSMASREFQRNPVIGKLYCLAELLSFVQSRHTHRRPLYPCCAGCNGSPSNINRKFIHSVYKITLTIGWCMPRTIQCV